jgi:chromosome segregation ATPase
MSDEDKKKLEEECSKLKEKVAKLQQLLAKAKEQFDAKARGASEAKAEAARLRGELSAATTLAEDLRAKLNEEQEVLERAQEALRALRREQSQRQEALEARVNGAEAELAAVQEEFRAYKLRAQSAIRESATLAQAPDPSDFLRLRMENEALARKISEAEVAAKAASDSLAGLREESQQREQRLTERVRALEEERGQIESKHKRALAELEAEYGIKYEELRSALGDHRDRSKRSLAEKDSQLSILQAQLTEARQQLVKARSESTTTTPHISHSPSPTLDSTPLKSHHGAPPASSEPQQSMPASAPVSPSGPLLLLHTANLQSMKEVEVQSLRQRVALLEHENGELERTAQLHEAQERALKEQIRELDRSKTRETVNVDYLKNVVVKYMETEEHDRLVPVIATLLHLTPEEIARINDARRRRSWSGLFAVTKPPATP